MVDYTQSGIELTVNYATNNPRAASELVRFASLGLSGDLLSPNRVGELVRRHWKSGDDPFRVEHRLRTTKGDRISIYSAIHESGRLCMVDSVMFTAPLDHIEFQDPLPYEPFYTVKGIISRRRHIDGKVIDQMVDLIVSISGSTDKPVPANTIKSVYNNLYTRLTNLITGKEILRSSLWLSGFLIRASELNRARKLRPFEFPSWVNTIDPATGRVGGASEDWTLPSNN